MNPNELEEALYLRRLSDERDEARAEAERLREAIREHREQAESIAEALGGVGRHSPADEELWAALASWPSAKDAEADRQRDALVNIIGISTATIMLDPALPSRIAYDALNTEDGEG